MNNFIAKSVLILFALGISPAADAGREYVELHEIAAIFKKTGKKVVTFAGYSGLGYEDSDALIHQVIKVLELYSPTDTLINIGATPEGIGSVYPLAKGRGFETTGIVSSQAELYNVAYSEFVDHIYIIEDQSWGGLIPGQDQLFPTSQATLNVTDSFYIFGGGEIAADEMQVALEMGKEVKFFEADMNHALAISKATQKQTPIPLFSGPASVRWSRKN